MGASDVATAPPPEDRTGRLYFGIFGPPAFWVLRLGIAYVLVPYACWHGWTPLLHAVSAAGLIGCATAGWVAWGTWRGTGGGAEVESDGARVRARFMGLLGMLLAALFGGVIVAEGIGGLMIDPCISWGMPADWAR
jgi:hypothetical protein